MQFVDNAKQILLKAWSVRLAILAALFSGAEVALPFFVPFLPEKAMAILAVVASAGAAFARIVAQPKLRNDQPQP